MEKSALQKAIQRVCRNQFVHDVTENFEVYVIDSLEAIAILEQLELDLLAEQEIKITKDTLKID